MTSKREADPTFRLSSQSASGKSTLHSKRSGGEGGGGVKVQESSTKRVKKEEEGGGHLVRI